MLVALAARHLPPERQEWGQAMLAELDHIERRSARRRFALGCLRVAFIPQPPPWRYPGRGHLAVVTAGVLACLGLAGYGLIHYPGLRDAEAPIYTGLFLATLGGYAFAAFILSQSASPAASQARRYGLIGGLAVGGVWLAAITIPVQPGVVPVPYLAGVVGPAVVGLAAAQTGNGPYQGVKAATWALTIGNLIGFVCFVTRTYITDGRPYDATTISAFQHSSSPDLATFAVSDNLGGAVFLLLLPAAALILALLFTAARSRYSAPRKEPS
jgi:hypothetical protein